MGLEIELDKFLKIKTNGRDDTLANFVNFPYEPTPYCVLQVLANSGYIAKKDKIIDYGCGKGRVDFFLAYSTKAKMIGVEYDERLYNRALDNKLRAISANRVEFIHCNAKDFLIDDDVTAAYFFNPFSIEVLSNVIDNIREAKKRTNKEYKLFFYYISKEYLEFINENKDITLLENIDCMHLFNNGDKREYIAIYKI